jgi:hypothetical protein
LALGRGASLFFGASKCFLRYSNANDMARTLER